MNQFKVSEVAQRRFLPCVLQAGAVAILFLFSLFTAAPALAQAGAGLNVETLPATATSKDGLLTVTLSATNPSDAVDVNNTFTWTATNNSTTTPLQGVVLGSHWGDYCIGASLTTGACKAAFPEGPTLISLAPGCGGQSAGDLPAGHIAILGVWCTPSTGVTLAPGASVSGTVTVRPRTGGPVFYTLYSGHTPLTGTGPTVLDPAINYRGMVAPLPTDVQITGAASTGSPSVGSTFTYTYQVHNAGPRGTFGGITFVDTLPASLTYVSSSVTQAGIDPITDQQVQVSNPNGCSAVGQTVVCPLQDMTIGGLTNQATITLTVTASGVAQPIANTASVHTVAPQDNSNPVNNSVTVNVTTK
jgi:uncharacterized repeat protein (TIGR01451 family)